MRRIRQCRTAHVHLQRGFLHRCTHDLIWGNRYAPLPASACVHACGCSCVCARMCSREGRQVNGEPQVGAQPWQHIQLMRDACRFTPALLAREFNLKTCDHARNDMQPL